MVKHIVMFRMAECAEKEANIQQMKAALLALIGKVESLRSMEVGVNCVEGASAFDLVLVSVFDDMAGLDAYRVHPEHLKVVEMVKHTTADRAAVDYVL